MRMVRFAGVVGLVLLVASCSPSSQDKPGEKASDKTNDKPQPKAPDKPQDLLVGKWKGKEKMDDGTSADLVLEFTKDGKMKHITEPPKPSPPVTLEGTFKFLDDTSIETEIRIGNASLKEKQKIVVTKEKLTETDEKGKTTEFTRVP